MKIQINTDKNIDVSEELKISLTASISDELSRYNDKITRLEIHLSDEDGDKDGKNDIRCMLEARLEGMQPIAVRARSNTNEEAVSEAVNKLKASLKSKLGRLKNY
jgi:ribosomal subunit interface protein